MRGTSRFSAAIVCALAAILLLASVAYGAPVKKLYEVDITAANPPVTTGQAETFDVVIQNKTATQSLGSCNLTLPASVTGISATAPVPAPGTATVVGSVIQLRDMSIAPMSSKSFTFTATSPDPGTYTATVECRQANNYSPSTTSNVFTLDKDNSTLSWTAVAPLPNIDLAIATTEETPDPVIGGNTVKYVVTVTNTSATNSANITVTDSVTGAGSLSSITGDAGWSCGGSGNSRTCNRTLGASQSSALDVRVLANTVSSPTSVTNAASVAHVSGANDPNAANNSTSATTTVNPGSTSGTGFIDNQTGGVVISEPFATPTNKHTIRVEFPPQEGGAVGGFIYNVFQVNETCALLPCTFGWHIDDIPAPYDNPVTEGVRVTITCDATVCTGTGTAVTMFERDETGSQQIILGCNIAGIVDPAPCVEDTVRLVGGEDQGDLRITMLFLAGDPKVAGLCVGSC